MSKEVRLSPSAEEIQKRMAEQNLETAVSYADRMADKRKSVNKMKGRGRPLGGAPPLDPDKMSNLASMNMPKPVFMDGPNQEEAQAPVQEPVQEPIQEPEPVLAAPEPVIEEEIPDEDLEEEEERDSKSPSFDFSGISAQQKRLMSSERRRYIESRLSPLKTSDLIMSREVVQDIEAVPGSLVYTLRTYSQKEYLYCLEHVFGHTGSAAYVEELLNTCKLTCALVAINGAVLPKHVKDGEVDKEAFANKMRHISNFPVQIIADLSIQVIWFNDRINNLFSLENLKNG